MQYIIQYDQKVTTTSLIIAEVFEKEHKNVLRDIETLECSDEFRELNFELSSYKSKQNKALPFYHISRDGFSMLVMSFTGAKAAKFKELFIKQFNEMEEYIRSQRAETPKLIPTYQARILSEPTKECPVDRWNVFDQSHEVMLTIEKLVGSVNKYDLADGSIGIHWSKFRQGKTWTKMVSQYAHRYKDKRGAQLSNCYDYAELMHFKIWLASEYKPLHLVNYLENKYRNERNAAMLKRVQEMRPKLIA